jgi:hypothetical protein
MATCPRCGWPLDPDSAVCFACAQGLPRSIVTPRSALFRPPPPFFWRGAAIGMGGGLVVWSVLVFVEMAVLRGPIGPGPMLSMETLAVFWLAGGLTCGLAELVWKSLLRPVLLALFASEKFQREYGTPEERGIVRKSGRGE